VIANRRRRRRILIPREEAAKKPYQGTIKKKSWKRRQGQYTLSLPKEKTPIKTGYRKEGTSAGQEEF